MLCSAAWITACDDTIYDGKFYRVLGKSNFIGSKNKVTLNMKSMKEHIYTHRHHLQDDKPKLSNVNFNSQERVTNAIGSLQK